jgi:hypothetical protein
MGQLGRAQEYRWFATRCLEIVQRTADPRTKAAMLQMAQVWSRLAEQNDPSVQHFPDSPAPEGAGKH